MEGEDSKAGPEVRPRRLFIAFRANESAQVLEDLIVPNPFPGMDPYLEGDLWMTVHTDLCVEIARQLAPKIRPKYVALSARRVVLAGPDGSERSGQNRFPHVGVVSSHSRDEAGAIAVATAPLVLLAEMPEDRISRATKHGRIVYEV